MDELLDLWDCAPDGEVLHGGIGIILPVHRRTGEPAALKVSFPHPGNVHEPDAFAAWRGRGAVLLHERDDARFAMLLERAQTSTLADLGDEDEIATVAGRLSRRLTVPAPPGLPRLRDQADTCEEQLRKDAVELAHSLPHHVLDAALATVRDLGRTQPDTLVHGDLHARNILRADREPWLAVDPAYDAGTFLTARALRALALLEADDLSTAAHRTLDVFTEAAGLDRERVQRWAQFHAARAAFHGRRHGFRRARTGPQRDWFTAFADHLAGVLTDHG